jgi:hypothetical protein
MLKPVFHAWERRLASVSTDRVVRPFEWGLDWIPHDGPPHTAGDAEIIGEWVAGVMGDTDAFFTPPPTDEYLLGGPDEGGRLLTFPSAFTTPSPENNIVHARYFPAASARRATASVADQPPLKLRRSAEPVAKAETKQRRAGGRAAVLVLPQWNSNASGHVGLCKILAWSGLSALRLALPYHDQRMPPELQRADYIVSSNVARTVQVCRQAVLDARRAIQWLARQGYERIGILGTSLGSCLALLTTAHEPLIRAEALNHISPYFADVVWRGLSTRHVRQGFDGRIELDLLRTLWKPISPRWYLERVRDRRTLLVYARYDLTFPIDLSEDLVREFRELDIPHEVVVLPCGHYSSGKAPFKFLDAWVLTRFLRRALL